MIRLTLMRSVLLALLLTTGQWLATVHAQDHERLNHTAEQCELCLLAHALSAGALSAELRVTPPAGSASPIQQLAPVTSAKPLAAAHLIRGPPQTRKT